MDSSVNFTNPISSPKIMGSLNLTGGNLVNNTNNLKTKNIFENSMKESPKQSFSILPKPAPLPSKIAPKNIKEEVTSMDEEEDPFEAFMKGVEKEACVQDSLGMNKKEVENVISFEEIMNMNNDQSESVMDQSNMDSDDEMDIDTTTIEIPK